MLGMAQASQWAGWWSGAVTSFTGVSAFASTSQTDPNYSVRILQTSIPGASFSYSNTAATERGSFNITGLTGFSGYNNYRAAHAVSMYLPSAQWTGSLPDQEAAVVVCVISNSSASNSFYNMFVRTETVAGVIRLKMQYQPGFGASLDCYLPGPYTDWTDRWITVTASQSNTASSFSNWNESTTGALFVRIRVFDSETGTVIGEAKTGTSALVTSDYALSSVFGWDPGLASLATTLYTTTVSGQSLDVNCFCSNGMSQVLSNRWHSLGQTFDPLTVTDRSWLTATPSAEIGGARAWLNNQYTTVITDPTGYAAGRYSGVSGMDLYSQPSGLGAKFIGSNTGTNWTDSVSTTRIIRNS